MPECSWWRLNMAACHVQSGVDCMWAAEERSSGPAPCAGHGWDIQNALLCRLLDTHTNSYMGASTRKRHGLGAGAPTWMPRLIHELIRVSAAAGTHSTVTLLARLRGLSTSVPLAQAVWYASNCSGTTCSSGDSGP